MLNYKIFLFMYGIVSEFTKAFYNIYTTPICSCYKAYKINTTCVHKTFYCFVSLY